MITHRCKGSLKAQIPIRYCEGIISEDKKWRLFDLEYNYDAPYDPFSPDLNEICSIKYCPFCGKELSDKNDE